MIELLQYLAVISSGLYGVLLARSKGMDLVGICGVAFIVAFGGGTLRDVLLDYPEVMEYMRYIARRRQARVLTLDPEYKLAPELLDDDGDDRVFENLSVDDEDMQTPVFQDPATLSTVQTAHAPADSHHAAPKAARARVLTILIYVHGARRRVGRMHLTILSYARIKS